jgi:hypothetical protein
LASIFKAKQLAEGRKNGIIAGLAVHDFDCVLTAKLVKADRLPEEAGLRLLRKPSAPREVPVSLLIRNAHGIGDWEPFLLKTESRG